jgi:hypothetical protein
MDRPQPSEAALRACGYFNPQAQIENYADTAAAEAEARKDAMLGLPETLCGQPVRPLTWRHLLWLDIYNSPFLMDAKPEILAEIVGIELHIARFLWVTSPDWRPYGRLARKLHFLKYRWRMYRRGVKAVDVVTAIVKFMDDSLWDLKNDSPGHRRKSYYSTAAAVVHALCDKYGALSPHPYSPHAAIDVPLRIVGQLLRVRMRSDDPKALLSNRTDELEREWLRQENEKLKRN